MALGDGTTWDETAPTDATSAVTIDDHNRDLRKGISGRMRHEHEWPASQSATSEAGKHKFITLQEQTAKPTLSGTQKGGVYTKTDHNLYFENSAGTEVTIVAGTAVGDGKVLANSTDASADYLGEKIGRGLTASGTDIITVYALADIAVGSTNAVAAGASATVTFGKTMGGTPFVVAGYQGGTGSDITVGAPMVSNINATGCKVWNLDDNNAHGISWIAVSTT